MFAIEAHRGARAERPENTLPAFVRALELGVTAIELDVGVTADGVVIVSHERRASPVLYRDTRPVVPRDPWFPYVGMPWRDLTLARIRTLEAGLPCWNGPGPDVGRLRRRPIPGTWVPTLGEVFALAGEFGIGVRFEIEAKRDPRQPHETVDAETFVRRVVEAVRAHGMEASVRLRSFDWSLLLAARWLAPWLPIVALASMQTVERSAPWTCGLLGAGNPSRDGLAIAARRLGAVAVAPETTLLTDELIAASHDRGLEVIPWTVNDSAQMRSLIARDVDGLTTDDPRLLREVMASMGQRLPPRIPTGRQLLAA